ncbi:12861_t:CDS:1, partial [Dentiscutata heterogama]
LSVLLVQKDDQENKYIVAYTSYGLTKAKRNYTTTKHKYLVNL